MGLPLNRESIFEPNVFLGFLHYAKASLGLVKSIAKSSSIPAELRSLALNTIYEIYPIEQWANVYTDGSAVDRMVGSGVYSQIFQLREAIGHYRDNVNAELYAICMVIRAIENTEKEKIVQLVDSMTAIHTITNYTRLLNLIEFESKKAN